MILDYPELLSDFVVLTGAGYPVRQAWKKQVVAAEDVYKRQVPQNIGILRHLTRKRPDRHVQRENRPRDRCILLRHKGKMAA